MMKSCVAKSIDAIYCSELELLGQSGAYHILEEVQSRWDLTSYAQKGVLFFPHTYLKMCGHQVAAVVHACLNSGSDQILALGPLHAITDDLSEARSMEREGKSMLEHPFRGLQGPGLNRSGHWEKEFSLKSFVWLCEHEARRRGIFLPKIILRYPFLTQCDPHTMPGMDELKKIAQDSVVVATGDFCHQGVAYQTPQPREISREASIWAQEQIKQGFQILQKGDYPLFYQHCFESRNDAVDVCLTLSYLYGPKDFHLLDLHLVDTSDLFLDSPKPSWVVCSLAAYGPNLKDFR